MYKLRFHFQDVRTIGCMAGRPRWAALMEFFGYF